MSALVEKCPRRRSRGFEVGQLAFVGVLLLARAVLAALPVARTRATARIGAYAIGALAAFWVCERLSLLLGIAGSS